MSSYGGQDPFSNMGGARPHQPSIVPKIIAVFVVLFLMCAGGLVLVTKVKFYSPMATGIYANTKDDAKEVTDDEIWTEYTQDDEMAHKAYGEHWVIVSGICAEPLSIRPDKSALNEEVSLEIGKRRSQFNEEWKIHCRVPPENAKSFMNLPEGTQVKVLGVCKGIKDHQVILEHCELRWRGL